MRRRHWAMLAIALALGVCSTIVLALVPPVFRPKPASDRLVMRLFSRHGDAWLCNERSRLLYQDRSWMLLQSEEGHSPDEMLAIAWRTLEPFAAENPRRQLVDALPRWGTLASSSPPPSTNGFDRGFGWPFICLWYRRVQSPDGTLQLQGSWSVERPTPLRPVPHPVFPTWLIYPGLAGNLALHSAIWAALFFTPRALRRHLRRRRGHCINCGYDLRGNDATPCPECGHFDTARQSLNRSRHTAPEESGPAEGSHLP
jgi:hypothetical protein